MPSPSGFLVPDPNSASFPLLRTDYANDDDWASAWEAAVTVYERDDFPRLGAALVAIEAPELDGLTPAEVAALPRAGYPGALAVADAQTMRDHSILFIDRPGNGLDTFRCVPEELEAVTANLMVANLDFVDFSSKVGPDGVFRGFR